MRFRKLRIAWSVVCAIACVLLIALWVRSYWWMDDVQTGSTVTPPTQLVSQEGAPFFSTDPELSEEPYFITTHFSDVHFQACRPSNTPFNLFTRPASCFFGFLIGFRH